MTTEPSTPRRARRGKSASRWRQWLDHWLIGPDDRDEYLGRLGGDRILQLEGKARPDSWRAELLGAVPQVDGDAPVTATERMIVAAASVLADKLRDRSYNRVLSGLGAGNLAAWLAHARNEDRGVPTDLVAELGLHGYRPRPCDPYLFNFRNLATCTDASGADTALGLWVGGAQARCVGSLGAGQVDASGAFNSTRLADGTLLVGSGGANDVACSAREVVITLRSGRSRLVAEVPYVTAPGDRVTAVVTELGVFEKLVGPDRLRLTRLVGPLLGGTIRDHLCVLRDRTVLSSKWPTL